MRPTAYSATALLLLCAPSLVAQAKPSAAIPVTAPTQSQSVSDLPSAHPNAIATNPTPASSVIWDGSLLTIEANGDPMPELLGRVAHETGMKITGGVPDERIYGKYGPASVQVVFGQLFDGLAVNMMLVNATPTKPKELLLTVRSGAPTPPSTRQVVDNYQPQRVQALQPQPQPPQDSLQQRPNNPVPPPAANTATNGNADASTNNSSAPATDTTQPQSPNGVKTPEQIFEELRKRQQQNPQ